MYGHGVVSFRNDYCCFRFEQLDLDKMNNRQPLIVIGMWFIQSAEKTAAIYILKNKNTFYAPSGIRKHMFDVTHCTKQIFRHITRNSEHML